MMKRSKRQSEKRPGQKVAKKKTANKIRWVAVSGGFDPLHIGHVRMFRKARKLGDKLVVILNNDNWLKNKKGFAFMPEGERKEIIENFSFVDKVVLSSHKPSDPNDAYHRGVSRELKRLKPAIFANGGDRNKKDAADPQSSLYWDIKTCEDLGIKMVYSVGHGGKVQSSSWMIKDAVRGIARGVRPWGEFYGWDEGARWKLKTIYIKPGKRLSLQYHNHRSEHWTLVEGDATATIEADGDHKKISLMVGQIFAVPLRATHRLESEKGGVIVEIGLGEFNENDIVRLDDDHGRVK
jgi:cytidyltransferase-like protein